MASLLNLFRNGASLLAKSFGVGFIDLLGRWEVTSRAVIEQDVIIPGLADLFFGNQVLPLRNERDTGAFLFFCKRVLYLVTIHRVFASKYPDVATRSIRGHDECEDDSDVIPRLELLTGWTEQARAAKLMNYLMSR